MPIYEYHCNGCKKTFERFQKMSDDPVAICPDCKGKVKRLISQTSFSLKGGGWYKDGYSSASSSSQKADKPKDTKTEKKPEKK